MKQEISILIPTYNHRCFPLVKELARQASLLERLRWEIIVAEDGSTDERAIEANAQVNSIAHCRQIVLPGNLGRAAIRNYLASQARHSWLLFIDSDMSISLEDYLLRFLSTKGEVVYGGYHVAERAISRAFAIAMSGRRNVPASFPAGSRAPITPLGPATSWPVARS